MSIHATSTEVYSGKNLLNYTVTPGHSATGNYETGVGSLKITQTTTSGSGGNCFAYFDTKRTDLAGQQVTFYTKATSGGGSTGTRVRFVNSSTNVEIATELHPTSDGSSRTFTVPSNGEIRIYFYANASNVTGVVGAYSDYTELQLEKGSTATAFEPYVGGVPSPLISGVSHVSTSKNLLNMQSDSNGEYLGTTSQQTYSGKNILNASSPFTVTNSTVYRSIPISIPNGTTVCVQCDSITTNSTTGCSVRFQDSNFAGVGTVILYPGTTLSQSVTLIGDATYCYVYSSNNYASSQSATTTYTNLMVSIGSTAQPYEPYVGGIPSPNPDYPQEIVTGKLKSKNLFALGKTNGTTSGVSYTYNSDGTFSLSGTANAGLGVKSAPIPISESGLIPGQKYSFWCDHNVGWGSNSCVYYAQSCDSVGNWTGNLMTFTQNGGTATMPETTTQYVMFVAAISNGSSYSDYSNVKAQLVAGEQVDNVFEPYFTPIELAQISNYQDKVYKSGDDWYVHKEFGQVDLSTLSWDENKYNNCYIRRNTVIPNIKYVPNNKTLGVGLAEKYILRIGSGGSGNDAINHIIIDVNAVAVNTGTVANIPVTGLFYYQLATPTNTAITDSATIAWLNKYDTDSLPHHKYVNTRRTTYVGASGLASAIDLYDGSYASTLPTYSTANDHHLTTANGGTYTVSLQNISAKIVSGTVTFSVFTNQRKIDFSWNGSATSTSVSVSLQADEYIKSIYAYIPQNADAGITLSQQLESGSLTDFEPYYNIVKIYAGDDLVFEDTSLTD